MNGRYPSKFKNLAVPLDTGYRENFRSWVPLGTEYRGKFKLVPAKFSTMLTPGKNNELTSICNYFSIRIKLTFEVFMARQRRAYKKLILQIFGLFL